MSDEKVYYRHVRTGDRGYLVMVDGKKRIRRDSEVGEYPFSEHEWIIDRDTRPLSGFQVAAVTFEADRALCRALGMHREAARQWLSLSDEQRIKWTEDGPPAAHVERYTYWKAQIAYLNTLMG